MAGGLSNIEVEREHHEMGPTGEEATLLREVLHAIRRIRHGQVQIHIQDGRVVQIDQTEKFRVTTR